MKQATVRNIVFHNPDSGYTVATLEIDGTAMKAVLTVPFTLASGQQIEVEGEMFAHAKYGSQFKASKVSIPTPSSEEGVTAYLSSGIIAGIGPATAERIVSQFGVQALTIMDTDPHRLLAVKGIGQKTLAKIADSWKTNREGAIIVGELCEIGLTVIMATKVYKALGGGALQIVKTNPYRLAEDVLGIGFRKADEIAEKVGLDKEHPFRISSGILFTLKEALAEGHCFLPKDELQEKACEILKVPPDKVAVGIASVIHSQQVIVHSLSLEESSITACYLKAAYFAERYIEKRLKQLASTGKRSVCIKLDPRLTDEQKCSVSQALEYRISVITGPAGSGKTFVLSEVIRCLEQQKISYALAAPTGKASKRIYEVTQRPASTIHRLLGYGAMPEQRKGEENPLNEEYVIVDETSMVDVFLMADLLKALPTHGSICFLGDVSQLPPVGAGLVFRDIIDSGLCPVNRLTKIHRQHEKSNIIRIASEINNGTIPAIPNSGDSYMFQVSDPEEAARKVVDLVTKRIPEKFGIPIDDIMTITPIKKGPLGTIALNHLIQAATQPPDSPALKEFKSGDRVMQTVNDYSKGVFNGEIGKVVAIDLEQRSLLVLFDDIAEPVEYSYAELTSLSLAASITVHKSQGGQAKAVVLCLHSRAGHYVMLKRDLLYTAATRSRNLLVIVGDKRAIAIAVKNNTTQLRYTGLFKGDNNTYGGNTV